jgi:hypothetical protein
VRWAAQVTIVPRMLKPIRTPAVTRNVVLFMTELPPLRRRGAGLSGFLRKPESGGRR